MSARLSAPASLKSRHTIRDDQTIRNSALKNCCRFFHHDYVFFLTPLHGESIHSSTAIEIFAESMQTIERENRQMATKKAAKKAPAKKAAKKAAKKK